MKSRVPIASTHSAPISAWRSPWYYLVLAFPLLSALGFIAIFRAAAGSANSLEADQVEKRAGAPVALEQLDQRAFELGLSGSIAFEEREARSDGITIRLELSQSKRTSEAALDLWFEHPSDSRLDRHWRLLPVEHSPYVPQKPDARTSIRMFEASMGALIDQQVAWRVRLRSPDCALVPCTSQAWQLRARYRVDAQILLRPALGWGS